LAESEPPDHQSVLRAWRQGDFALGVGPFIYGDLPENPWGPGLEAYFDEEDTPGFVVVSQTCDIVSDPAKNPWVVVCPLVKVDSARTSEIERGGVPRLAIVENAPEGHVAELARHLTISKSLLVTWQRRQGFTDPAQALEFARSLERCFGRFAFPDAFNSSIAPLLKKLKDGYGKQNAKMGRVARSLAELRVRPSAAWQSGEVHVRFFLFLKPEDQRKADLERIRSEFETILVKLPWQGGFQLDDPSLQLGTYDDFLARDYIESVALDINALSFAARYQASQ
jgi:hypothetical protein